MTATTTERAARWAWIRSQTPAMERTTYLNCGFSGPLSLDVAAAMQRRLDLEVQDGPLSRHVQEDKTAIMDRLRQAEERYRRLLEMSPDAVMLEADGEIVYVNPAMAELLAMDAAELAGRPVGEIVSREGSSASWPSGGTGGFEAHNLMRGDGREVPVENFYIFFNKFSIFIINKIMILNNI